MLEKERVEIFHEKDGRYNWRHVSMEGVTTGSGEKGWWQFSGAEAAAGEKHPDLDVAYVDVGEEP